MNVVVRRKSPAREAWALLLELLLAERSRFPAVAAELGLSPMQAHLLKTLEPGRPVPMSALACALSCDASNVTGIVDRLEHRDLIARRPDARDRRVKMLELTPRGQALRARLLDRLYEPPASIARLGVAEQRLLRDLLRRAVDG